MSEDEKDRNVHARFVLGLVVLTVGLVIVSTGCNSSTKSREPSGLSTSSVESSKAAAHQPTFKEREGITNAMPAWLRRYPVGCVWLEISVSSNGRYAKAGYGVLNPMKRPCSRFVSNGGWFLKKQAKWRIIFNGSDPPPCSLKIPRELTVECLR
jgi:hypothetical protein